MRSVEFCLMNTRYELIKVRTFYHYSVRTQLMDRVFGSATSGATMADSIGLLYPDDV